MIKNIKWLLLVSVTLIACSEDDVAVTYETADGMMPTKGTADFSKYVALGDSYAAGFSDGALFIEAQKGSYPNILAQQFALVGGGGTFKTLVSTPPPPTIFTNPLMADNIGGFLAGGVQSAAFGKRLYYGRPSDSDFDGPLQVDGVSGTDISAKLTGSFGNLGVPGAKCIHLVTPGYGSAAGNPYFARFASSSNTTVLADALSQNPTFFSLWIGGNDVLGYALAGGDSSLNPLTPSAGPIGVGFDASYNSIITSLAANGRKGVTGNLPYVTTLPQFTFIQPSFIPTYNYFIDGDEKRTTRVTSAADFATINTINGIFGFLDQVLTAYGQGNRINVLSSAAGATNPVIIVDETLTDYRAEITAAATASGNTQLVALASYLGVTFGKVRQTTTGDLIPLTTSTVIGTAATIPNGVPATFGAYGITYPLEDRHVLIPSEILEIRNRTDAYNITIEAAAKANNIAFVDLKAMMIQLSTTGITANNYTMNATFVTGGTFSLDGFHPTPRGYALFANKFIEAINKTYGSNLKAVNLGNYRILFPRNSANF
jgi:hypothetical protein